MDAQLSEKVLKYVQVTSLLAKRALDEKATLVEQQEKAAAEAGPLVETLRKLELIGEHQTKQAETLLSTHAGTQQILRNAVDRIAALRKEASTSGVADLGKAVGTTDQPKFDSLSSPYVGLRTSEKKASDEAYVSKLMG